MLGVRAEPQPPSRLLLRRARAPGGFGNYGAWVHHTPGHCPGGVCLAVGRDGERARTLFVGDTLFAGSIGRTDLPGGDLATLLHSIRERPLHFPDDTVVHPGHGEPTTIGTEKDQPICGARSRARVLEIPVGRSSRDLRDRT